MHPTLFGFAMTAQKRMLAVSIMNTIATLVLAALVITIAFYYSRKGTLPTAMIVATIAVLAACGAMKAYMSVEDWTHYSKLVKISKRAAGHDDSDSDSD